MPRPIPDLLIAFLRREEGVRHQAYRDSGGVWTIGVGHAGPEVRGGLVWTDGEVDAALRRDLGLSATRLRAATSDSAVARLNDDQYSALLSFVFNCGAGAGWAIWTAVKDKRNADVPGELIKFVRAGGRTVPGLIARRKAEIALWTGADPVCVLPPQ